MLCKKVKEIDSKIRFAGVINERGRLVAGGIQDESSNLVDAKTDELIFVEVDLRIRMRKDFDPYFGKMQYTTTKEKCNVMRFPMRTDISFCFC